MFQNYSRSRTPIPPLGRCCRSRSGAVLILTLICMGVVSAILANVLQLAVIDRRQQGQEFARVQVDWLLEAGLERAVFRRAADRSFDQEIWHITAEQLDGEHTAEVEMIAKPVGNKLQITIAVNYSDGTPHRVFRRKTYSTEQLP
jgi:type II secretory pathway component PulK